MVKQRSSFGDEEPTQVIPRFSMSHAAAEMHAAQTLDRKVLRDVGSDEVTQILPVVSLQERAA